MRMIENRYEANLEDLNKMIEPILSSLEEKEVNHKIIYQVNLVLEELLANICRYAYSPNKGYIDLSYELNADSLRIVIKDKGRAFNPLEEKDPDLTASSKDRPIGGLGIYLTKKMVDSIKYQRIDDANVLEFEKNLQ